MAREVVKRHREEGKKGRRDLQSPIFINFLLRIYLPPADANFLNSSYLAKLRSQMRALEGFSL